MPIADLTNDQTRRPCRRTVLVFAAAYAGLVLSFAAASGRAHAGFVLLVEHDESMDLVFRDLSADGSVIAGEVTTPTEKNGALWSPLEGAAIFDLAPGQDDGFRSVSADGSLFLTHVPGGAPYGQIWSESAGVVASAPSLAPAPDPVGLFMSSDGTTLLMGQTVPGTPDVNYVWRWSTTSGYAQIGVGTSRAISADGASVLLDAEISPGVVAPARWTSSTGVVAVPGLAGLSSPGFADMSADGSVLVGGDDVASGFDPAIVWTEAAGLSVVGAPDDGGVPIFARFDRVTPDGGTAVGRFRSLLPPAYDQLVQPMTWSAAGGFTIVHDELRRQGIDFEGIETVFITAVSDDGTRIVGIGYSPTLGVPFYSLLYDLDPDHPPTQGTQVPAGAGSFHALLAWPFATGGLRVGFEAVDVAGRFVATYRSTPPDEIGASLPDPEDLLALVGDRPKLTSWALEFDGALASQAHFHVDLEVPKQLAEAVDDGGALQMLVHDGTGWQSHTWSSAQGRVTAFFDDVPEAIVLVPTQVLVPVGTLVVPGLVGAFVVASGFRLRRARMRGGR